MEIQSDETADELRAEAREADRASICLNLKKAARATTQVLDNLLAPVGIRASQLSVLNQLSVLGTATVTELAEAVVSDRTTLTRNLGPLVRDGYVVMHPGRDKRVHLVTLTESGRDLLARALPLREQAEQYLIERLGVGSWQELLAQLDRLTRIARR